MNQLVVDPRQATHRRLAHVLLLALVIALMLFAGLYAAMKHSAASAASQPVVMQAELASKTKTVQEKSAADGAAKGSTALPYLEARAADAGAYLRLIVRRGGVLLLTRGFKPIATLDQYFISQPVAANFFLPSHARNVTTEVQNLLGALPDNATMALLLWPERLEQRLEQALRKLPVSRQASRLRAIYKSSGDRLELEISQAFIKGNWSPVYFKIVL